MNFCVLEQNEQTVKVARSTFSSETNLTYCDGVVSSFLLPRAIGEGVLGKCYATVLVTVRGWCCISLSTAHLIKADTYDRLTVGFDEP